MSNGTSGGNGNGNGYGVNMRLLIQVLTFAISIVATGIGGSLFIVGRIDSVNHNLTLLDGKMNTMFTIHSLEDWKISHQRVYNHMLATRNTNIIVPDLSEILMSVKGP